MCSGVNRKLAILIDLSGTLHVEDVATPNAVQALKKLRQLPQVANRVRFVTNTTKESRNFLLNRLKNLGFDVRDHELHTSLTAAKDLISHRKLRPMLLLEESALEDFSDIDTSDPNSVVIGLAPSQFHYERLNSAFKLLMDSKKPELIAIHKGRYYKRGDGLALGPGPFVSALEYATGVKASIVGKPQLSFYVSALQSLAAELKVGTWPMENAVMIGDDCRDDALGALNAGLHAILVKTGKYRAGDESNLPDSAHIADTFANAVDLIESGAL